MSPSLRATTAMPRSQQDPITVTGSRAAAPRMPAAIPNAPKSTDLVTTAVFASVGLSKTTISIFMPSGWKRSYM